MFHQFVGLLRPPAPGGIEGEGDGAGVERIDERLHDPPRLVHLVAADEEGRVAQEGVAEDPLVGLRRTRIERLAVAEIHPDLLQDLLRVFSLECIVFVH